MRYRMKFTNMLTGEKNRAQNCLTVSNPKPDDVFSDVFGKSSCSIFQHIWDHPGQQLDVAPFIDRRCKHPVEEIQAGVDGAVSREQAAKLKECLLTTGTDPHCPGFFCCSIDGCCPHLRDQRGYVGISLREALGFLGWLLLSE